MRSTPWSVIVTAAIICAGSAFGEPQEPQVTILVKYTPVLLRSVAVFENSARGRLVSEHTSARDVAGGTLRIRVPCRAAEYVIRADALVSAPVHVNPAACNVPISPELFLRSELKGTIVSPAGSERPAAAEVHVRRCVSSGGAGTVGSYRTAVSPSGAWAVAVPADCLDVLLTVDEYAPERLPRMALSRGQTQDVGAVVLRPGATVNVTVKGPLSHPVPGAVVAIAGVEEYPTVIEALLQAGRVLAARQVSSGPDGVAVIAGVPPLPSYIIASSGNMLGVSGPFEPEAGTVVSERVSVKPPPEALVHIVGNDQSREPGAKLVLLATPRVGERWVPSAYVRHELNADGGPVRLPIEGRWRFELHEQTANVSRPFMRREAVITSGAPNTVEFDLRRSVYRGRVTLGGQPQQGTLTLLPKDETAIGVARSSTDAFGDFSVPLMASGAYAVEFSSTDGQIVGSQTSVEFLAPHSRVDIVLPNHSISGTVVTEDGAPAAAAMVTARAADLDDSNRVGLIESTAAAAADGRFAIKGMRAGEWEIRAVLGAKESAPKLVTAGFDGAAPTQLVVRDLAILAGRVVTDTGSPVPGAEGVVFSEPTQPGEIPSTNSIQTDMLGYFRAKLDRPADYVQVQVFAPGRPLAAFRFKPSDGLATLTLPSRGGDCRIVFPRSTATSNGLPQDINLYALVNEAGAMMSLAQILGAQAASVVPRAEGTTMIIPHLAPGTWRLSKFVDVRAAMLYLAGTWPLPVSHSIRVTPGASARVTLNQP